MNNRVYLAGPDVFFTDVTERSEKLKILCDLNGLEGVFPLDFEIKLEEPITQQNNGYLIFNENIKLIDSCSAILANISPFRGPSIDPGTAFDIGYAFSRGLVVVAYTSNNSNYKERVQPDGLMVEDFGMVDNLMIHSATFGSIFDRPAQGIEYLSRILVENSLQLLN